MSVLGRINHFYWTNVLFYMFCIKDFPSIGPGLVAHRGLNLSTTVFQWPPKNGGALSRIVRTKVWGLSPPQKHSCDQGARGRAPWSVDGSWNRTAIIFVLQCHDVWPKSVCANLLHRSRFKGQGYRSNSGTELLCLFCVRATSMATRWPLDGYAMATRWLHDGYW